MGGDLVVVLVFGWHQNMAFWARLAAVWLPSARCSPSQLQPVEQPCHVDPEARAGLRLGDLADRLGGSGLSVVHQDVPSVGSASISSAMA
jgi:hypothetical protein